LFHEAGIIAKKNGCEKPSVKKQKGRCTHMSHTVLKSPRGYSFGPSSGPSPGPPRGPSPGPSPDPFCLGICLPCLP